METEIILHRGYKGKYLENSLSSFENAVRESMSFETDIRISKNGKPFMTHDEDLNRLLNSYGRVREYISSELKQMQYKEDGSHLVSFKELLHLIKKSPKNSCKIFVHIKNLWDLRPVMDSLNFDLRDRLRFFACDDITLKLVEEMKRNYRGYRVGLHITENSPYKNRRYFEKADFIWADEITNKSITPELVGLAHEAGKPIYAISPELIPESAFNSDIKGRWREFIEMNVDGICTDKSNELSKVLKNY